MTITLTLRCPLDIPIEAETITPASFAGQTLEKSCALEVRQGNRVLTLGDFFHLDGTVGSNTDDTEVVVIGDLRMVKRIGMGMDGGRMTVIGDAGMYLGAEMRSGRILVKGSVDAWAGAEMRGGNIQIEGDAGDYLCAGYPGSKHGMRGGRVFVSGNSGAEMASHMHRGFIAVKGHVGDHAAARMSGGTIMIGGSVGQRLNKGHGACNGQS
jgi:formylmethanofuran dehydrogenase subunit C